VLNKKSIGKSKVVYFLIGEMVMNENCKVLKISYV
jgi:hypothetical protein